MEQSRMCKCGKPAAHETKRWWDNPKTTYQCCECYVREGNPPADWHPLCMSVYAAVKAERLFTK